jgi:uncharacterized membrane protein
MISILLVAAGFIIPYAFAFQSPTLVLTAAGLLLAAIFFLLRRSSSSRPTKSTCGRVLLLIILVACCGISINDHPPVGAAVVVLWYPVIVSLSLAMVFVLSTVFPPTIIEKIAIRFDPQLTPPALSYCRKVTMMWITFFLINASIAAWTVVYCSTDVWLWYNGFISYCLIGLLFMVEYIVRRALKKRFAHPKAPLSTYVALLVTASLLFCKSPAFAEPPLRNLDQVLHVLQSTPQFSTSFTQQRYLKGLPKPFVSEGILYYDRDKGLRWETNKPIKSVFTVDKTGISFQVEDEPTQKEVHGAARRMSDLILSMYRGSREDLEKEFSIKFSSETNGYRLQLLPKDQMVSSHLQYVELEGLSQPLRLTLAYQSGDKVEVNLHRSTPK